MNFALIRFARGIHPRTVACDYLSVHRQQRHGIDAGIYSTVHSISKAPNAKNDHHWLTPILRRIPRSPTLGVVSCPRCSTIENILRCAVLHAGSYILHKWWTNGTWPASLSTKRTFVPTDRPTHPRDKRGVGIVKGVNWRKSKNSLRNTKWWNCERQAKSRVKLLRIRLRNPSSEGVMVVSASRGARDTLSITLTSHPPTLTAVESTLIVSLPAKKHSNEYKRIWGRKRT